MNIRVKDTVVVSKPFNDAEDRLTGRTFRVVGRAVDSRWGPRVVLKEAGSSKLHVVHQDALTKVNR